MPDNQLSYANFTTAVFESNTPAIIDVLENHPNFDWKYRGLSLFHWAAITGNLPLVEYLVNKGWDIHERSLYRDTPLHHAAWNGHVDVTQFLLDKGSDVHATNDKNKNALHGALEHKHAAVVDLLLQRGAKKIRHLSYEDWLERVGFQDFRFMQHLPREAIDGLNQEQLDEAMSYARLWDDSAKNSEFIHYLLTLGASHHCILKFFRLSDINVFVNFGVDPRPYANLLLENAIKRGEIELAKFTLENGADLSAKTKNGATFAQALGGIRDSNKHSQFLSLLAPSFLELGIKTFLNRSWFAVLDTMELNKLSFSARKNALKELRQYFMSNENLNSEDRKELFGSMLKLLQVQYPLLTKNYSIFQRPAIIPSMVIELLVEGDEHSAKSVLEFYRTFNSVAEDAMLMASVQPKKSKIHILDESETLYATAYLFQSCKEVYVPSLYELMDLQNGLSLEKIENEGYKYIAFPVAANPMHHVGAWVNLADKTVTILDSLADTSLTQAEFVLNKLLCSSERKFQIKKGKAIYFDQKDNWSCGVYAVTYLGMQYLHGGLISERSELDVENGWHVVNFAYQAYLESQLEIEQKINKHDQIKRILLEVIEVHRFKNGYYHSSQSQDPLKPLADFLQFKNWGNIVRSNDPHEQLQRKNEQTEELRVQTLEELILEYSHQYKSQKFNWGLFLLQMVNFLQDLNVKEIQFKLKYYIGLINKKNTKSIYESGKENKNYKDMYGLLETNFHLKLDESEEKYEFIKNWLNSAISLRIEDAFEVLLRAIDCSEYSDKIKEYCPNLERLMLAFMTMAMNELYVLADKLLAEKKRKVLDNNNAKIKNFTDLYEALYGANVMNAKNKVIFLLKQHIHLIQKDSDIQSIFGFLSVEYEGLFLSQIQSMKPVLDFESFIFYLDILSSPNRFQFFIDHMHLILTPTELQKTLVKLNNLNTFELMLKFTQRKQQGMLRASDMKLLHDYILFPEPPHLNSFRLGEALALFDPKEWGAIFSSYKGFNKLKNDIFKDITNIGHFIQSVSQICSVEDDFFIQLINLSPYSKTFNDLPNYFDLDFSVKTCSILRQCWEGRLKECYSLAELQTILREYLIPDSPNSLALQPRVDGYELALLNIYSDRLTIIVEKLKKVTHLPIKVSNNMGMFSYYKIILPCHPRKIAAELMGSPGQENSSRCNIM